MDLDKYLIPEFDLSRLDPVEFELDQDVTPYELKSVVKNPTTRAINDDGWPIEYNRWRCFGFSNRSRCFELLLGFNMDHKYSIISFKLLDEYGTGLF